MRITGQSEFEGGLEELRRPPRLGHHGRQLARQAQWLLQPSQDVSHFFGEDRVPT